MEINARSRLLAADKNPKEMLAIAKKAQARLAKVSAAMDSVIELTVTLPGSFERNISRGNLTNVDNPKEYDIWVNVQNLKNLYSLRQAFNNTQKSFEYLTKQLAAYKAPKP